MFPCPHRPAPPWWPPWSPPWRPGPRGRGQDAVPRHNEVARCLACPGWSILGAAPASPGPRAPQRSPRSPRGPPAWPAAACPSSGSQPASASQPAGASPELDDGGSVFTIDLPWLHGGMARLEPRTRPARPARPARPVPSSSGTPGPSNPWPNPTPDQTGPHGTRDTEHHLTAPRSLSQYHGRNACSFDGVRSRQIETDSYLSAHTLSCKYYKLQRMKECWPPYPSCWRLAPPQPSLATAGVALSRGG